MFQATELATDQLTGGFSGAEIVSICQEAALLALEEVDTLDEESSRGPCISHRHVIKAIKGKKRQITPEMLQFYQTFQKG